MLTDAIKLNLQPITALTVRSLGPVTLHFTGNYTGNKYYIRVFHKGNCLYCSGVCLSNRTKKMFIVFRCEINFIDSSYFKLYYINDALPFRLKILVFNFFSVFCASVLKKSLINLIFSSFNCLSEA